MYLDDISDGNSDGRARLLNKRVQIMTLLYIDGASYINTAELGWRGFFLYRHNMRTNTFALLGFCTAYEFWHYTDQIRFRISQMLIFPPYQRRGHGSLQHSSLPLFVLCMWSKHVWCDSEVCRCHLPLCP